MAPESTNKRHQAHQLIGRLAPSQVTAMVAVLEARIQFLAQSPNASVDDEPESEHERTAVAESKAWFERHGGQEISHEQVLVEFGFTETIR
jgi:hypothetical protein